MPSDPPVLPSILGDGGLGAGLVGGFDVEQPGALGLPVELDPDALAGQHERPIHGLPFGPRGNRGQVCSASITRRTFMGGEKRANEVLGRVR